VRRAAFAAAALAAASVGTAAVRGQDAPHGSGDAVTWTERGVRKTAAGVAVESADLDHVVFVQSGTRTTLDAADVAEIRWGDAPREYAAAVAALARGDADSAAAGFGAALRNRGSVRGWLLESANAGLGEALAAQAPTDDAAAEQVVRAFAAARDANPKSFLLDRILTGLARAEVARGRPDAAVEAALALDAAAKAANRPAWEADAEIARAAALAAKNDSAGALSVLDAVVESAAAASSAAKDADAARRLRTAAVRATVRKIWLLADAAEAPRAQDAAERARKFAAEAAQRWPDDVSVAAAATGAEGALLLASGDAKEALRKLLEVEVAHFDVPEEAARALRCEAAAFERLGDSARGAEALRALKRTYPATEAARRAR
jgi:hypothetical protein